MIQKPVIEAPKKFNLIHHYIISNIFIGERADIGLIGTKSL